MIVFDIETGPLPDDELQQRFTPKTKEEFVGKQRWKPETCEEKYKAYLESAFDQFKGKAALDATTGQVLAIGFKSEKGEAILNGDSESDVLLKFWAKAANCEGEGRSMVGHNIEGFDIPFLVRRSWILGIDFEPPKHCFVDTLKVWACGSYGEWISLDKIANALGCGQKTEGCTGADFSRLWHGTREEHQQAIDYLKNDLKVTWNVAQRLGVL